MPEVTARREGCLRGHQARPAARRAGAGVAARACWRRTIGMSIIAVSCNASSARMSMLARHFSSSFGRLAHHGMRRASPPAAAIIMPHLGIGAAAHHRAYRAASRRGVSWHAYSNRSRSMLGSYVPPKGLGRKINNRPRRRHGREASAAGAQAAPFFDGNGAGIIPAPGEAGILSTLLDASSSASCAATHV